MPKALFNLRLYNHSAGKNYSMYLNAINIAFPGRNYSMDCFSKHKDSATLKTGLIPKGPSHWVPGQML